MVIAPTVFLWLYSGLCANSAATRAILITIDDLRADHLGCYGYSSARTRHIDQIAKEGAIIKIQGNDLKRFASLTNDQWDHLTHLLARESIETARFSAARSSDEAAVISTVAWIEKYKASRFACWIRFSASAPYNPPIAFRQHVPRGANSEYDAQLAYIDYQIGRIRDALARNNLLSSSLIVLTTTRMKDWHYSERSFPLVVSKSQMSAHSLVDLLSNSLLNHHER